MAFVCRLIEGILPAIDLFYSAIAGWAMLEKGLEPNDPERRELWGGYLEDQLVRQEDGKRVIPLKLQGKWTTPDLLIDAVNAVEERLRHAARFRKDGWGDEVFLEFQLHSATYAIRYPVCSGSIDKNDLMNACGSMMESGHRVTKALVEVGITLVCENYWEADTTYALENYIDNPGFWRGAAPGDSWTEVNGADVTSTIDTTIYGVMGKSLKQVYVVDAVNNTGVISDAQAVVASTAYYFEVRNYRMAACDVLTAQVFDISNAAVIATSVRTFNGATGAWIKQGVTFNTPVGCISVRVELLCLAVNSAAGGTAYWDAIYLTPGTTAPVGWCSGRNLVNHLDDGADDLNVLCVTEIPGEVEAECQVSCVVGAIHDNIKLARRTRDDPSEFIWQLNPCAAYTTAEGGAGGACVPGLTDAACIDTDKIVDATSPTGSHVNVTFAGNQTMQLRCYWNVTADLSSYYGKYQFLLLAKKSAATDTVTMRIITYAPVGVWTQGGTVIKTAATAAAGDWKIYDGWETFSFPIGTHWNDYWAAGNRWQIQIHAAVTGSAAWDNLQIAGLYLIPVDEAYGIYGASSGDLLQAAMIAHITNIDGDYGLFIYSAATNRYYSNAGALGARINLTPEVENWFYFIHDKAGTVDIDEGVTASVTYRSRGIFLRGTNP